MIGIVFHQKWLKAAKRVLKPNGTLWVSGTYHSIYLCGHALQKLELDVLWEEINSINFEITLDISDK